MVKELDAPYGSPWFKCKRVETFDLVVTEKVWPSIRVATMEGESRGLCCARAASIKSISVTWWKLRPMR